MDWKPIETAPKDGTRILLFRRDEGSEITDTGQWYVYGRPDKLPSGFHHNEEEWIFNDNYGVTVEWTHWMPLPEPPTASDPTQ